MLTNRGKISQLLVQIFGLLLLYSATRFIFWINNSAEFEGSFTSVGGAFFYGMRFDIAAICMINLPFILFSLIPVPFRSNTKYLAFLKSLFIISNSFFLLLNLVDAAYFPFIHKRMQFDAFLFLGGDKGSEFYKLVPAFLFQFWYLWLAFIVMVVFLFWVYNRSTIFSKSQAPTFRKYIEGSVVLIVFLGLSVIALRGGLQLRPLKIINAAEMSDARYAPLLLNSPFSVVSTFKKRRLEEKNYFPESEMDQSAIGIHTAPVKTGFTKENVVVIIIESFSKNRLGLFNDKIKTPFLDSLAGRSALFVNGFANAKESVQGIPAVLASIPSWQDDAYIFSPYSSNRISSFAGILRNEGYTSSFFHGGTNGTMGFTAFCKLAGFDQYFGREEFNDESEYDGYWGIWDEPFLQYMAEKLSEMRQPFISSVFTLTPHHPFVIPEKYKDRFKSDLNPAIACMEYLDYSLSQFFNRIKSSEWYNNTLFIITADHTAPASQEEIFHPLNEYRIPILFHRANGSLTAINSTFANQIDILPSAMHLMNYPASYFSLGNNLFSESCPSYTVNYNSGVYQLIDSAYCYQFNGVSGIGLFNWKTDPALENNLIANAPKEKLMFCDTQLKKRIQAFNRAMVRNTMTLH